MSSARGQENWLTHLRAHVGIAFWPVAALAIVVSTAVAASMLADNPGLRQWPEAPLLMLYSLGFHAALIGIPATVVVFLLAWIAHRRGLAFSRGFVLIQVMATSTAVLLALNAMLRFTLSYTLLRPEKGPIGVQFVTPLGLLNDVLFLAGPPLLFVACFCSKVREGKAGCEGCGSAGDIFYSAPF